MTSPEARILGKTMAEIMQRLEDLEAGLTVAQIPSSSVYNTALPFFDAAGNLAATIGSNGVLLTDVNGMAQSTFDNSGSANTNIVNIVDSLNYRGQEFSDIVNSRSAGLIAWTNFTDGNTSPTAAGSGIAQLDFDIIEGRAYEINCSPIVVRASSGTINTKACSVELRYTADGSVPSITSTILTSIPGYDSDAIMPQSFFIATASANLKVLLAFTNLSDVNQYVECNTTYPVSIWVTELSSVAPPSTGRRTTGTGSGSTPQQYVKTYTSEWSRSWSVQGINNGTNLVQGNYQDSFGDWRALFGFDYPEIASDLTGATVTKTELFLYCSYAINNDGAYVRLRTTPLRVAPTNNLYPNSISNTRWARKFPKPGSYWVDLGTAVGNEFRLGTTASFAIDATDISPRNNADAGWWNSAIAPSNTPLLRITYVK